LRERILEWLTERVRKRWMQIWQKKRILYDGRTGKKFPRKVTVGAKICS
jgi:DNA-directed RNA polymerase beta subunit